MHNDAYHPLFLAIDQGGQSSRAFVFDAQGALVAKSYCDIKTETPKPGWVEQDAEDLVDSVKQAIADAVEQLGEDKKRLSAAGLATQRASIVCWKRDKGQALSKVLSWQDRRNAIWMKTLAEKTHIIHARTGLFPSPHYGASKLRWCIDHLPDVQSALSDGELVLGPLASFIAARITEEGKPLVDPANASRTLLFNMKTAAWDHQCLELFDIPIKALPQCVPSRFSFGHIAVLKQAVPLTVVTGDQSAALFHTGFPRKDVVYINLGTGAFLQRVQENKATRAPRLLSSIVFHTKEEKIVALEGTVNGAGSALKWFAAKYQADEWPQHAERWLRESKDPPIFINAIGGMASPFWNPRLESRFIGKGNIAAKFTAVIESILFLIQANLDEMNKTTDAPTRLILSGGLSTLNPICQGIANLSNIEVERPAEPEATSRGLAYLLSEGISLWPECHKVKTFLPNRDDGGLRRRYLLAMAWYNSIIE